MMTAKYFSDAKHVIEISFGSDCLPIMVDAKKAARIDLDSKEYFEASSEAGERGLKVDDDLDATLAIQAFAVQYETY